MLSNFFNLRKKPKQVISSHCMNLTQSAMLTFSGWEDVSPQDNVQAVFHFIPEDDQKFAYEQFFRKLGKYRFKYQKRLTSKRKKRKKTKKQPTK